MGGNNMKQTIISIHALRGEGDIVVLLLDL